MGLLFSVVVNMGPGLREILVNPGSTVGGLVLAVGSITLELGSVLSVANSFSSLLRVELDSEAVATVSLVWSMSL